MQSSSDAAVGRLRAGLALRGDLRWVAADIRDPLEAIRLRLDLSPLATVALGRTLIAAALLQRFLHKEPTRLCLVVDGDGPLGKIVAEVDEKGSVRGSVEGGRTPSSASGEISIASAVGKGILRVDHRGPAGSSSSRVELVSGEIGKDVAHLLDQSYRIHSAVLVGVLPRPQGIAAAGGLIVEALPGCSEDGITTLEANIEALDGVSRDIEVGGIDGLYTRVFEGLELELGRESTLVAACRCRKETLLIRLRTLARGDLEEIFDDRASIDVTCAFCGRLYSFLRRELLGPGIST